MEKKRSQSVGQSARRFESRKRAHLVQALRKENQAMGLAELDQVHLIHEALPDLNFKEISLHTTCLGHPLPTPFYVAGMTAGHSEANRLNQMLARACQKRGWAMGVGSQRRQLHSRTQVDQWIHLRKQAPELVLFANLGVSQLIEVVRTSMDALAEIVESIDAQALVIHSNALQEVLQPEGTPSFKGAESALRHVCEYFRNRSFPVVLKETGCGFSRQTLARLGKIPVSAVDVSGLGGTHWGRIEGARSKKDSLQAQASQTFANWGVPTAWSVQWAAEHLPRSCEIWGSGGVRSGLDAAKLIALGAHRIGYAQPALQAAIQGEKALDRWMELQEFELRVALFCTGQSDCHQLRKKEGIWTTVMN